MKTRGEQIKRFLNHDGVNKAWVAERLFGKRSSSNTSRLRKKHLGIEGRSFTETEIIRLDEIRRAFVSDFI